ncbi:MAG: DUF4129 domain-containing protein [Planctomycetota bacterium]
MTSEHASDILRVVACWCWSLVVMTFLLTPTAYAADLSDGDAAIEAAREGLDSYWERNWYDSEADDFKPINLPVPRKRTQTNSWSWLDSLFSSLNFDFGNVLTLIGWLALIAVLVAIVHVMIKASKEVEIQSAEHIDDAEDGRTHIERVEALPVALERPVGNFLDEARRLYAAGDLTLAIVYLFSYQLIELDKRRLLRLVKGKTNRQYLRELRRNAPDHPRLPGLVEQSMLLFERAFFGAHPPDAHRLKECLERMPEFERLAVLASAPLELAAKGQP